MTPATAAPEPRDNVRLMVIDPVAGTTVATRFADLPTFLAPGDVLVVNDAATLPASLHGRTTAGGHVEIRVLGPNDGGTWRAIVLGAGDWHTRTEHRPAPPLLSPGDQITCVGGLTARIVSQSSLSTRLVGVAFDRDGAPLWSALYAAGAPVQYAHVAHWLPLWSVQTVYAARPWAAEMPSAGRPLTWEILMALRRRGVRLAALTHAAGLSSTGDAAIDAALPLPERYDIPPSTVGAIDTAQARGSRVVAVGTTVVRALEGCVASCGHLRAGTGETDLVIDSAFSPRVVDALLSGVHAPTESHWQVLRAFADDALLRRATRRAEQAGFRCHEFGDSTLILPRVAGGAARLRSADGVLFMGSQHPPNW